MLKIKKKADKLYQTLVKERCDLIEQYKSNGEISYDEACGIIATETYATAHSGVATGDLLSKDVPDVADDGRVIGDRTVLDFDAIKENNNGKTMREAFEINAKDKVVTIHDESVALDHGGILLFDVPCMLKLTDNLSNIHWGLNLIVTGRSDPYEKGTIHAVNSDGRDKVENRLFEHRGQFNNNLYKGDREWLNNPVSLWSTTDTSRQSIFNLGINSLIRMWGDNQVVDLNGFTIRHHDRPNTVAGFASVFDLSDGAFAGLSTRGCKNCHIFSSKPGGRIGRSNHTAFRGHFVENLLVENVLVGEKDVLNSGPYFGVTMLNQSKKVVFKDVHQEQTNHHVVRSSLGLNWYSILNVHEQLFAKFVPESQWAQFKIFYPWLKWEDNILKDSSGCDYIDGKKTQFPIIDPSGDSDIINALLSSHDAYKASSKNFHDMLIQANSGRNGNAPRPTGDKVLEFDQLFRVTNLTVANPVNREEGNMYPDSTVYGFRAGSDTIGVGNLASEKIDPWSADYKSSSTDIYLVDCKFENMAFSMTEAVTVYTDELSTLNSFGGMGLRPLGYSNSRNPGAGLSAGSMLYSKDALACLANVKEIDSSNTPDSHPVNFLDMAERVATNFNDASNVDKYSGLYKGNDVLETALATTTAIAILKDKCPNVTMGFSVMPNPVLSGLSGDNLDIGILAWRKSVMSKIGASTACHIGLKGGYHGDINDRVTAKDNEKFDGEIYPWYVKRSTSTSFTKKYKVKVYKNEVDASGDDIGGDIIYYSPDNLDIGFEALYEAANSTNFSSATITVKVVRISPTKFKLYALKASGDSDNLSDYDVLIDTTDGTNTVPVNYIRFEFDKNDENKRLPDGTVPPSVVLDKDNDYYKALDASGGDNLDAFRELIPDASGGYGITDLSNEFTFSEIKEAFRMKLENGKMSLVDSSGDLITYKQCADLLGISSDEDLSGNTFEYTLLSNSDGQNHSAKGMFGIRLDQVNCCGIINCAVNGVENTGLELDQHLNNVSEEAFKSGLSDVNRPGSHHNDFHGVSINGCSDVLIEKLVIDDAITLGKVWGVEVRGQSSGVYLDDVKVDTIVAGTKYGEEDPFNSNTKVTNKPCIGVRVSDDSSKVSLSNISVRNIESSAPTEAKKLSIESLDSIKGMCV
jgi:hypothetical protein